MRLSTLCFAAAFAAVFMSSAQAATLHNAVAKAGCGGPDDVSSQTLSPTALAFSATASAEVCTASGFASVGAGTVRVSSFIENPQLDNLVFVNQGSVSAAAWVNYQFTLRSNFVGLGTVPVSINLHASGNVSASSNAYISDQGAFLNSGQRTSASLRAWGAISDGTQSHTFEERVSVSVNAGQDSVFDALSGAITTPKILLSPGQSGSITFGLDSGASGFLTGTLAGALANGGNSVSFALDGDVFNLPVGYFIDIDEPRIIDNQYSLTDSPTPVPLPAGAWLLVGALAGLITLRRNEAP